MSEQIEMIMVPAFDEEHQEWLVDCLAHGIRHKEIAWMMRKVFPNFAKVVPDDEFERIVKNRINSYLYDKRGKWAELIKQRRKEIADTTEDLEIEDIPIVGLRYRLEALQTMWDNWEPRSLVRMVPDDEGNMVPVYKSNIGDGIAILKHVDALTNSGGGEEIAGPMPNPLQAGETLREGV